MAYLESDKYLTPPDFQGPLLGTGRLSSEIRGPGDLIKLKHHAYHHSCYSADHDFFFFGDVAKILYI